MWWSVILTSLFEDDIASSLRVLIIEKTHKQYLNFVNAPQTISMILSFESRVSASEMVRPIHFYIFQFNSIQIEIADFIFDNNNRQKKSLLFYCYGGSYDSQ